MNPSPQQMATPQQMSAAPISFHDFTSPAPARTAYDIRYETTMSPFVRAKYGLGGGPPTTLSQLQEPRVAAGAAVSPPPAMSRFTPSGTGISAPRLNPLQFGQANKGS